MPSQDRACDCYASGLIITLLQLLHLSSHIPLHHMRQQNVIFSHIYVMIHTIVRNDLLSSISKEMQNFDRFFLMQQTSNYPLCIRCWWMAPRPQQFSRASTPWLSTWSASTQWWERRAASPSKDPRPHVCFLSLAFWLTFSLVSFDLKVMRLLKPIYGLSCQWKCKPLKLTFGLWWLIVDVKILCWTCLKKQALNHWSSLSCLTQI